MFSKVVRGGKAYATKQILRELKKRIKKKKIEKDKRTNSYEIIKKISWKYE